MSEFDDADLDDSYIVSSAKETKGDKPANLKLGLLIGIGATIVLELVMGLALDTQSNLVHRYISYMLGIGILFVAAIFTKSTLKMFFVATPVIIGISFVLPYFLPDIFSPLMAPFLNLFPLIDRILESSSGLGLDLSSQQGMIDLVFQFGFVFDLVIAMIVGGLAALGISGILKILRGKVGILTIFTFGFTVLFFILGVIIFPYIIVIFTGGAQFAMAFGVGSLALNEGMTQVAGNGTIDEANAFFSEAKLWFIEAENMLDGLAQLQLFTLLGQARPSLQPIIDNGLLAVDAGINLAQGVGPLLSGVTQIQQGITKSMGIFDTGNSLSLSATPAEIDTFNEGLDEMEIGFANISQAIDSVKDALVEFGKINKDELNTALQAEANQDLSTELDMMDDAITLFNSSLSVLQVLIETPTNGDRAPFIHLIQGAFALNSVSDLIGTSTSFEGTGTAFEQVVGNLTVVINSLSAPEFAEFKNVQINDTSIAEIRDQIAGMFEFIEDAGNIAINIGEFGIIAAPTLISMNNSLSIFNPATSPYENFTVIPDNVYDEKITALEIVSMNASQMKVLGADTDLIAAQMQIKSQNQEYGFMSDAASEFSSLFGEFNLTENGANFAYIANGFQNLMKVAKSLKLIDGYVKNIQVEYENIASELPVPTNETVTFGLINMDGNLTLTEGELDNTLGFIAAANGNFTLISNMPQLVSTGQALLNISDNIENIKGDNVVPHKGISRIREISQTNAFDFIANVTQPSPTLLDEIQTELFFIESEFGLISGEMTNVDIAS